MNDWDALDNRELWDTATREVVDRRLVAPDPYRFFTPTEQNILEAFCDRLIPQEEMGKRVPIAPRIDAELATNGRHGYRLEVMPWPPRMWQIGLAGLEGESLERFGRSFAGLSADEKDGLIADLAANKVSAAIWKELPAKSFFTEALKTAAKIYYAHPISWNEISFPGPAYPRGYFKLECGGREHWEPPGRRKGRGKGRGRSKKSEVRSKE